MVTRQDVVSFLNLFKGAVMLGYLRIKDRKENTQGLLDLGMSAKEREEILLGLVPDDYVRGPKPDDTDPEKEVWEFGKNVEGTEVYIKLRVAEDTRRQKVYHAMVWSFHPAKFPMRYPLRGGAQ